MAFIGNSVQNQGFAPAVDYFNGDGTTVTFTLSRPVASVAQLTAVIENVIQNPASAFTVSGNQITFTSAPPAGTNNVWAEYTSLITQYNGISQDPSVVGDITASGGYLATGDFGNSYLDGTVVDYVTGASRITTGPIDDIVFYHGGTASRSEIMRMSYTGNVGIGTSSPTVNLHVEGSGASSVRGLFKNTNTSTGECLLTFADKDSSNNNQVRIGSTGNNMVLYAGNTERMRIDSSGRVTMPYQPAFAACGAATSITTSGGSVMAFSTVLGVMTGGNRTSGYNTSTYRYTAPVAGLYSFSFIVFPYNGSGYTQWAPYKNGAIISTTDQLLVTSSYTDNYMANGTFFLELAVGDYVDMRPRSGYTGKWFGGHSLFMGYLIG